MSGAVGNNKAVKPSQYEDRFAFYKKSYVSERAEKGLTEACVDKIQSGESEATLYYQEHKNDMDTSINTVEREAEALYQIFQDTKDVESEKLKASGLLEMLAFTNQLLLTHCEKYHGIHADPSQNHDKIKRYRNRINEVRAYVGLDEKFLNEPKEDENLVNRIEWILKQTKSKFVYLLDLICHPSMLRDQIGWTNLTRIFWVFYHFSLNEMLLIVKDAPFIEKLGKVLGRPINVEAIYKTLNVPNDVLNVLSVAFFGVKLVIDAAMIAKHTYNAKNSEKWNTFCAELDKRLPNIVNCFVWGGVNAMTNYPQLLNALGIPVEFAMPIVAGVLTFDVALSFWVWSREQTSYYKSFNALTDKINGLTRSGCSLTLQEENYLLVLQKMLAAENEKWSVVNGVYQLNSTAAVVILTAFSASLLLANPLLILGCYLIGCLSLSIYASASSDGDYAKYLKASHRLAYAQEHGELNVVQLSQLKEEKAQALSTFVFNLFERAFIPLSLLVLIAINPMIGITASVGYLTYKLYQSYENAKLEQNNKGKEVKLCQFSLFKSQAEQNQMMEQLKYSDDDQTFSDLGLVGVK